MNDKTGSKSPLECEYSFFQHKKCEFFPCHNTESEADFNCLFCYCPLYALGKECGGNYRYLENGIKDCSSCLLPHRRDSYERLMAKFPQLANLAKR